MNSRGSLDIIRQSWTTATTEEQVAMVNWHVVSFGRFAATYHLAAHGYYFEAMALARDLWEVALAMAALKRNIVTVRELAGEGAATPREMGKMSQEVDRKIRVALLNSTNNPALSEEGVRKRSTTSFPSPTPPCTSPSCI